MRDLWGKEITEEQARVRAKSKTPQPLGFAALPGTGPEGETCSTCRHIARFTAGWAKCDLMKGHWTNGRGTDIKVRSPACRRWEGRA